MNKQIGSMIVAAVALIVVGSAIPQAAPPPTPIPQGQPMTLADIKMLAKAGISDEIIISQIRSSRTAYRLSTAEILDLKDNGVSEKVIDFMINTPNLYPQLSPAPPPPAPSAAEPEAVAVTGPPPVLIAENPSDAPPRPGSVWIAGFWRWHGGSWMWTRGHWELPPYPGAIWAPARYERRTGGSVWIPGYWRQAQ